ncbi:uracil-DNA glycosylase [Fructobacillus pseudoficulneus]|uniref:Uracil-DNA glycosylase n=1 Tax=Fructobacillus pseudoficulneus TaxID=220714 RepID=A0A3F3H3T3_9LACO|nr:uracil-DNA glycosylase [Fructobacillus pseudoficulneus]SEH39381.1 Uracil-DNA glycosylase [Fructobacillus pseudoficulneus]
MADFHLTNTDWDKQLAQYLPNDYPTLVQQFLDKVYSSDQVIHPDRDRVFFALKTTPLAQTKVVILGQDPYHQPHQAQGLAFSVPDDQKMPPSLRNILQELAADLGQERSHHGLTSWADQGVLLLNTVLTVVENQANSHQKQIWEPLTDAIIRAASASNQPVVFVLWGKPAQSKEKLIDQTNNLVLKAPHPSPLAAYRGFFGSKPFSQVNQFLKKHEEGAIDWLK